MTPLIAEFARVTEHAEAWHWFDTGNIPELVEASFDDDLFLLPFPRTMFVGVDTDASKFCVALISGEGHVSVAGWYFTGLYKSSIEPFSYVNTDEGLRIYGGEGKEPPSRAVYMPVIGLITQFLQSLKTPILAYTPTPKKGFINQKRLQKGKLPLYDWNTVVIEPRPQAPRKDPVGTHASPRLHDRRGHQRKLPSGKTVWVKPCKVGNAALGTIFHDYQVRT
jgi:hypothetical protein